ncbi:MAG: restriction endonuclease subunit S, partial [Ruminiclostridium sp.]
MKCIEEEIPFEVPEGWGWCRLYHISEIVTGSTPNKKDPEYYGNDFPFFKPADLEQGSNVIYASEYLSIKGKNASRVIPAGSTAVCCIGSIGKCGYLQKEGTTNQQINSIIPYVYNKFVYYYCLTDFFVEKLLLESSATTIAIVNKNKLSNIFIPIPPLSEQKRISKKLEYLIKFVDEIEFDKASLLEVIKQAKSKILDLAIRGKLVPQDPNDEPASVLLERIRAEKEELIRQGKVKRDKKESVIIKGEDNSYYLKMGNIKEALDDWQIDDIPETWSLCCLGEVCDYGNCINVDTKDIPENAWILDLEDIEKDTGRVFQKLTKKERNSTSTKHLFHKSQVLYSKLRPYLNKVVLADDNGYCTSEILPLDFNACIL